MLYAILCYDSEDVVGSWTKQEDDAVMAKLAVVQQKLAVRTDQHRGVVVVVGLLEFGDALTAEK